MADQELKILVKEGDGQANAFEMLDLFAGEETQIRLGENGALGVISFDFVERAQGESAIDYGERFLRVAMRSCMRLSKAHKRRELYNATVGAIDIPEEPIDDDEIG